MAWHRVSIDFSSRVTYNSINSFSNVELSSISLNFNHYKPFLVILYRYFEKPLFTFILLLTYRLRILSNNKINIKQWLLSTACHSIQRSKLEKHFTRKFVESIELGLKINALVYSSLQFRCVFFKESNDLCNNHGVCSREIRGFPCLDHTRTMLELILVP